MTRKRPEPGRLPPEDPSAAALRAFRGHMELDEVEAARGVYDQARRRIDGWRPPPTESLDLIGRLIRIEAWDDAIRLLQSYIDEVESPSPRARLKLAQLVLQKQSRPARALRILSEIPAGALPAVLEPIRAQLARQARELQAEGPLELEDEL